MDDISWLAMLTAILAASWRMATPIIYAAIGGLFAERSGVLNIGIEGVMILSAFAGYASVASGLPIWAGFACAALTGTTANACFGLLTVYTKANQVVIGAAFNLLGLGISGFLLRTLEFERTGIDALEPLPIPYLIDIPVIGPALFNHNILVYLTLPTVYLAYFLLFRTSYGLSLQAAGSYPDALQATGNSVDAHRMSALMVGGIFIGIGGAYLTLAYTNNFIEGIVSGRGFMALAVIVFGRWTPIGVLASALLFGLFFALQLTLQGMQTIHIPYQFIQAIPYVFTILALVLIGGQSASPRFLAIPYRR